MIYETKLPLLLSLRDSAHSAESWQSTNQTNRIIDCHDFATQSLAMTKKARIHAIHTNPKGIKNVYQAK